MNRRELLHVLFFGGPAAAITLKLTGCAPGDCDPNLPGNICTPEDILLDGVAESGETQWQLVRRLWPDYEPSDLAFMVFNSERGYVFPDETDFDDNWNYTCSGGEKVLFLAAQSTV